MIFRRISTGAITDTPPPLLLMEATGFFALVRDVTTWTFPKFTQWDIQYSVSSNGVSYGPWIYGVTVLNDFIAYNYLNVDITQYYKFRCVIRSRSEVSPASNPTVANRPLILVTSGEPHTGTVAGYSVGQYTG